MDSRYARHSFGYARLSIGADIDRIMPEISRFFGIVIQMYYDDHEPPHFHARHGSAHAKIRLGPVKLLAGHLPPPHLALVLQWARLHEAELSECWHRIQRDLSPGRVAPLE